MVKRTQLNLRQYNGFSPWPEHVEFIVPFLPNGFILHRLVNRGSSIYTAATAGIYQGCIEGEMQPLYAEHSSWDKRMKIQGMVMIWIFSVFVLIFDILLPYCRYFFLNSMRIVFIAVKKPDIFPWNKRTSVAFSSVLALLTPVFSLSS